MLMVTPKHIIVLKVGINGLKLEKSEGLAVTKVNMAKWLVIYHLDGTLKPLVYKIKFKMTLEQM